MRKTNNARLIYDNQTFVGVDFGVAYCYEHEQGCVGIQNAFGLDRSRLGIDGFKMTRCPDESCTLEVARFRDKGQPVVGLYFDTSNPDLKMNNMVQYYLPRANSYEISELCAAWDYESFGIVVNREDQWIIEELMDAIKHDDLVIKIGSGSDHRGGLCLMIASRIPDAVKNEILANDRDTQKLYESATQTGIAEYLQRHRKQYYALKPSWLIPGFETDRGPAKTKYRVVFFLNPCEQHKYNCGWYTVEELKEWAKDRGPVCRSQMNTEVAVATLRDAVELEKLVVAMVAELKAKIIRDIAGDNAQDALNADNNEFITDDTQIDQVYCSAKAQADAIAKKLSSAHTATDLLNRIDMLLRDEKIRTDKDPIRLNPQTLEILHNYMTNL